MKEIDRRLRVIDQVIRHLVVRVDEERRVAQRTSEARKAFVARRRVARGLPPERQPGEGRGDGDSQDDMEGLEAQRWGKRAEAGAAAEATRRTAKEPVTRRVVDSSAAAGSAS